MEKIKLSNSVHDAPWVDATLFPHPLYAKTAKEKREDEGWKYIAIWPISRKFEPRYAQLPTYDIEGIENIYGSYYIQFDELNSGDWLISFKSHAILQSKYLKMTNEEMQKVLARKIDY